MTVHGRGTKFYLDDAAGNIQDLSSIFRTASGLPGKADRPETGGFAEDANRYEVLGKADGGPIALGGLWKSQALAKAHGRQARILVDQYSLYGQLRTLSLSRAIDIPGTDGFGDDWVRREIIGKQSGSLSLGGKFKSGAGNSDARLWAMLRAETPSILSVGPRGLAIGSLVELLAIYESSFGIDADHSGGPTPVSAEFLPDGLIDLGVSLHDEVAETTAGPATVNYTGVDEAAQTVLGWVAHLHAPAYAGYTSVDVKLQDSADGAAWADLADGAFDQLTAAGSQRLEGTATATVRRHVRAVATVAGSGSITFSVTFARRGSAYGAVGSYRGLYELLRHANTQTFRYGPEGGAAGAVRYTGECRASKLDLSLDHASGPIEFSFEAMVDGAVAKDTF